MIPHPKGWRVKSLDEVAEVHTGLAKGKTDLKDPIILPYLRVANVQDGYFDLSQIKRISVPRRDVERYRIRANDVLLTEGGDLDKLGRGSIWRGQIEPCLHQNHVFAVRTQPDVLRPEFLSLLTASPHGRRYFLACAKRTTNLASINSTQLRQFPVLLPSVREQDALSALFGLWDRGITAVESRCKAACNRRLGLMQQLLVGKKRFREFVKSSKRVRTHFGSAPVDWPVILIGDVANELSQKNGNGHELPVLSCTKNCGLVDSLEFFGRRIFSENTSTYKVVQRGDFAYATNHIEEGSIGYQNLHDAALISPMYTVFRTRSGVDHSFFFKLLKTELYRHIFEANTNGTINRRGALRWDDFARIKVHLPSEPEQRRIAAVLEICDREIEILQRQLNALKEQKRGLMQKLLTGKVRMKLNGPK